MGLGAIKSAEEGSDCFFIGLGLAGEAGLVDAVVYFVVGPFVRLFNLGP